MAAEDGAFERARAQVTDWATNNPIVDGAQSLVWLNPEDRLVQALVVLPPAIVATTAVANHLIRRNRTNTPGIAGGEDMILREAADVGRDTKRSSIGRWAGPFMVAIGLSALGGQLLEPVTEHDVTVPGSNVLVLTDQGRSMALTADMAGGVTRADAVRQAITGFAADTDVEVGIGLIHFGANVDTGSELTTDRDALTVGLVINDTDPAQPDYIDRNGGNFAAALDITRDVLAGVQSETTPTGLVIFTDGGVEESPRITRDLKRIAEDGTEVLAVITGTEDGEYRLTEFDAEPTQAAVSPDVVEGIEGVQTITATDSAIMAEAISEFVGKTTTTTEQRPFMGFLYAGAGFVTTGLAMIGRRIIKGRA